LPLAGEESPSNAPLIDSGTDRSFFRSWQKEGSEEWFSTKMTSPFSSNSAWSPSLTVGLYLWGKWEFYSPNDSFVWNSSPK